MTRSRSTHAPASDRDELRQRILATVDSIPRGKVATYGQVADEAGLPRRARLVGRVLGTLGAGSPLPWHRVIGASGRSSLEGASAREQLRRLAREGVEMSATGRIELARHRWST